MDYRERWELKDYLIGRTLERRIRLLHLAIGLLLVAFLLNFWYLQGVQGERYSELAENNRLRRMPLAPTRGVLYDRNGEVIASTRPSLNLVLRREDRRDPTEQLERLAPLLGVPLEVLAERRRAMRSRPLFEPLLLKEDIGIDVVARIEARREDFPSVEVREGARRYYPEGAVASHAVGYVGEVSQKQLEADAAGMLASGDIVGKTGLERLYDGQVRGERGWKLVSVNNLGRPVGEAKVEGLPRHGDDLHLTLDMRLQRELVDAFKEESGAGVFMDPSTGEVLALLSRPGFDPNLFADGISMDDWTRITSDPERPMLDRTIASYYAPGSIFKVVMATAALEEGSITPDDDHFCGGQQHFYGRRRLCWKRGGHGHVAVREALAKSCNIFFYEQGKELGIEAIHKYGLDFGLGRVTGIDVPGEESGILPNDSWKRKRVGHVWYPGDTISVAIGQGYLTVTPTQMATMISVVANGGYRITPHMVVGGGQPPVALGYAPSTMEIVRGGMADAVRLGTATKAALEGISVAGKTGTAQVHASSAEIDSDELPRQYRSHAWFVGYAPADRPRIAFAVIVEHGGHGGSSAAPIARRVLEIFFAGDKPDPDLTARR